MKIWHPPILLLSTLCLVGSSTPPDLDVGVPPGSPITWAQHFPALMPRPEPLIPLPATVKRAQKGARQLRGPGLPYGPLAP